MRILGNPTHLLYYIALVSPIRPLFLCIHFAHFVQHLAIHLFNDLVMRHGTLHLVCAANKMKKKKTTKNYVPHYLQKLHHSFSVDNATANDIVIINRPLPFQNAFRECAKPMLKKRNNANKMVNKCYKTNWILTSKLTYF